MTTLKQLRTHLAAQEIDELLQAGETVIIQVPDDYQPHPVTRPQ